MYTAHFGLKAAPFSITPDPQYLYLSVRHREALAHLLYGVNEGPGFVLLTGEVGTGKTTLCRSLIEQLPDSVDVALLLNPRLSPIELLATLFDELRISYNPQQYTLKDYIDTLNSYLLTAHTVNRRTVLILDEAQNTTSAQMLMLLTRLGYDSKCAITGDPTQIDLPNRNASGLLEARAILGKIQGLEFIELTERDVVRHPLVQKVIEAYQENRSS